jgi:CHAD domain-containing protein
MDSQDTGYVVNEGSDGEGLLEKLGAHFRLSEDRAETGRIVLYDTFDWRLHRAGFLLALTRSRGERRLLWKTRAGDVLRTLGVKRAPGFASDLPPGPFREALAEVIGIRRLLPIVELQRQRTLRVLDDEEKTVARIALDRRTAAPRDGTRHAEELPTLLRVIPVRGYDKAQTRIARFLEAHGDALQPSSGDPVAGLAPGSAKLDVQLFPDLRAEEGARRIYLALLRAMRENEWGVREDLDVEFLHEFRVAVRRTRAGLSRLKGILPHEQLAGFRREFAWLGAVTGPKRDLDVYVLNMADYRAAVPPEVCDDLAPLETYLKERQAAEQTRVVRALDSRRYADLVASWERFLEQPPHDPPPDGKRPIGQVAGERIRAMYRKVSRRGRAIDDETPAQALHDLRLDCKKLRYLLEFFRSLYDPKAMSRLIRGLKQLQDNLGRFNDLAVQQGALRHMAEDMTQAGSAPVETVMAMGRLIEGLEERQRAERKRFAERFARFDSPPQRALAKRLFPRHGRKRG